jgi:hypothetical protein
MKVVLSLVLFVLLIVVLSACAGTAPPTQAPVQAAIPLLGSTAQLQEPESNSTPTTTVIPLTNTPVLHTATPTPSLPPLEILNDFCYEYQVEGGYIFQIAGEVRNNTNIPMGVWINATIYDANHQVVGTSEYNPQELDAIPPGGKSPFLIQNDLENWPGATTCKEQAQGVPADLPRQDLKILSQESYSDDKGLHIQGVVQNTGTTPAEKVRVYATLFDTNGKVIAVVSRPTTLETIPAGGTSPFEFYPLRWRRYDHYEIQVEGRDVENP